MARQDLHRVTAAIKAILVACTLPWVSAQPLRRRTTPLANVGRRTRGCSGPISSRRLRV